MARVVNSIERDVCLVLGKLVEGMYRLDKYWETPHEIKDGFHISKALITKLEDLFYDIERLGCCISSIHHEIKELKLENEKIEKNLANADEVYSKIIERLRLENE